MESDSPDELFNNDDLVDGDIFDLGRRFMTTASPMVTNVPTNAPRFVDATQADFQEPVHNAPMVRLGTFGQVSLLICASLEGDYFRPTERRLCPCRDYHRRFRRW